MLLYATLIACAGLFAWQVYRYDLKDREPVPALLLAACFGAAGMWLAGLVQLVIMRELGNFAVVNWTLCMSAAAAVTEEVAKFCAIVMVIGLRPRWFNDPLDGLIYGAFAGLGAAMLESVALLAARPSGFLPATEPVRLAGHLVMGGIGGFGIAYLKLGRRGWRSRLASGLFAAVGLHFAWDVVAFDAAARGEMTPGHTAASMLLMLAGFVSFRAMIRLAAGEKRGSGGRRGFRLDLERGDVDRRVATPANAG
jgi:RsiW-degrading membrane proteinase PrsW (M82 family)